MVKCGDCLDVLRGMDEIWWIWDEDDDEYVWILCDLGMMPFMVA
jgi:hypothetical protein